MRDLCSMLSFITYYPIFMGLLVMKRDVFLDMFFTICYTDPKIKAETLKILTNIVMHLPNSFDPMLESALKCNPKDDLNSQLSILLDYKAYKTIEVQMEYLTDLLKFINMIMSNNMENFEKQCQFIALLNMDKFINFSSKLLKHEQISPDHEIKSECT